MYETKQGPNGFIDIDEERFASPACPFCENPIQVVGLSHEVETPAKSKGGRTMFRYTAFPAEIENLSKAMEAFVMEFEGLGWTDPCENCNEERRIECPFRLRIKLEYAQKHAEDCALRRTHPNWYLDFDSVDSETRGKRWLFDDIRFGGIGAEIIERPNAEENRSTFFARTYDLQNNPDGNGPASTKTLQSFESAISWVEEKLDI